MVATVTDKLRKNFAGYFLERVNDNTDSDEYYIGIGKADQYNETDTVVDPARSSREEREARNNLQSVKKVSAASFVIPRYNWTSGTIYTGYNDSVVGIPSNSYYVLTENNEVYICIQQGRNASGAINTSTVKPNFVDAGVLQHQAFETADGYRWKFLYALSATKATSFLSANYIPIQQVDSATAATTFELQQLDIKAKAIHGQILNVAVTNGGSGYTSAPSVVINGNGSGAAATATISGGSVVKIEMNNESAALGSGYDYASINLVGGGGVAAAARPIIGPTEGLGADVRDDLKSSAIMLNIKPDGAEGGTFVIDNDFRQIIVMKNPMQWDSADQFTATSGRAMRYMTLASGINTFSTDKLLRGSTSNAAAYVDEVDISGGIIYFHQNENTGFVSFADGELLEESDGSGVGLIDSGDLHSIVDPHSGEILYIENRARVIRNSAQQEDIKVIISV